MCVCTMFEETKKPNVNNITSGTREKMNSPSNRTRSQRASEIIVHLASIVLLLALTISSHIEAYQLDEEATTSTASLTPVTIGPNVDQFEPTPAPASANASNPASKLKPVNFTLVDEIFEASLGEEELVRRWRNMDAQFQDGIRSILKLVFPQIVAISQDAKVSGDCSGGILKWILSLRNLRSWAIKSK